MKKTGLFLLVMLLGEALAGCGSSGEQAGTDGGGAGAPASAADGGGFAGRGAGGMSGGGPGGGGAAAMGQAGAGPGGADGTVDGGTGSGADAGADGVAVGGVQGGDGGARDGGGLAGVGGQGGEAGGAAGSIGDAAGASGAAGAPGGRANGLLARYFDASGAKLAERIEPMPASASVRDHVMLAPFATSASIASITWDGWIDTSRPTNLTFVGFGNASARYTITIDDNLTSMGAVALVSFSASGWHKIHLGAVPSLAGGFLNARLPLFFQATASYNPNVDELSPTNPF